MLTLITFGDSILDSGAYNAHGLTPGELLVKNDDDLFPEFRGRDLSSAGPVRLEHRAVDGARVARPRTAMSRDLRIDGPAIALVTIGGNDLLGGLARDRGPGIDAFARTLEDFLAIMPIRPVLLGNVYDPTFGDDARNFLGIDPSLARANHRRVNDAIADGRGPARPPRRPPRPLPHRRPLLVHDDHRAQPPRDLRGPAVLPRGHRAVGGQGSGRLGETPLARES